MVDDEFGDFHAKHFVDTEAGEDGKEGGADVFAQSEED